MTQGIYGFDVFVSPNRLGKIIFIGKKQTKISPDGQTNLLKTIIREPFECIGKPEPLRHGFSGYWSRRINDEHRIVYKFSDDALLIAQCRYHY